MRLIDADVLKQHIDKLPALPDGNFAGNHSALKALINMQPTVQPEEDWIPVGKDMPDEYDSIFTRFHVRTNGETGCGSSHQLKFLSP